MVVVVAVTAAVTAVAVAGAIIFLATRGTSERQVIFTGQVIITDTDPTTAYFIWDKDSCTGAGRYGDVAQGAVVEVRDEDGKVLGVSQLRGGAPEGFRRNTLGTTAERCVFLIDGRAVPERDVYRVVVGRQAPWTVEAEQLGQAMVRLGD
ncbi:hypothetical protein ABZ801_01390 [Actinomadura sp. NPDC047616]|uniref:hypothetical protein n=1 Tax=Actinomadura sp. NPDC047616 TaxID=3155914 RepID=UPI0033FC7B19